MPGFRPLFLINEADRLIVIMDNMEWTPLWKSATIITLESRFNMMIRTLETLIYDCPKSISNGPPRKKTVSKVGVVTREFGRSGPPDPNPLPPVVAPLRVRGPRKKMFGVSLLGGHVPPLTP